MAAARTSFDHAPLGMVDIHCHLLPAIDDGARNLEESLAMARMAVEDGIDTVIVTPHQLGGYHQTSGEAIRTATVTLQQELRRAKVPLRVLPGADVRVEEKMVRQILDGNVLTLADRQKHVLLELPHELFFPIEPLLRQLMARGMVGILSHPERNGGILQQPSVLRELVDQGCLMQVTGGSLTGTMGKLCQDFSHWMLQEGLVHLVASDAHGATKRRPRLRRAWQEIARLTNDKMAHELCVEFPRRVVEGKMVPPGRRSVPPKRSGWFRRKAG